MKRETAKSSRRLQGRIAGALALALGSAAIPAAAAVEFEFSRLNRTYTEFVQDLAPVVLGPVEVTLRSPQHQLELTGHRAVLEPLADGSHRIRVEIELSGSGTIDAVLRAAGLEGKLEDDLALPLQTLEMIGVIRLDPSADGYAITLVEAPEQVEVQIESRLAGRLVPLCRQMALVLVRFDCAALDDSLSRVQVPIPRPPAEFLLPIGELTAAERQRLDAYVADSRRHCCRR
jgi:hypothetical protein